MTNGLRTSTEAGSVRRLPSLPRVERTEEEEGRVVAGICSGIARALGADASLVRLVFAVLALAGGSGIVLYLGAWLYLPPPGGVARGSAARYAGIALLAFAGFLALNGLGLAGSLLVPAALIALGFGVVSRRAGAGRSAPKFLLGAFLVVAGTLYYVNETGPFGEEAGPLAPGAITIALVAIVAPWLWRLARERDAERLERIRTQERADVAARVHDSVLQTLALVQRHADDPRQVGTLARQQERELRGWLYGRAADHGATLVAATERAAADLEQLHGVRIDVVSAGDATLDERHEALVLAAREAMTNAAKFAGDDAISVYVEAGEGGASVYVRDRGSGFDRETIPPDRHGIRESIEQRVARHGGAASITSVPDVGTEVELTMPAGER